MGSDDLHRKRKAKSTRDLSRRKARRDPYAKVLIVCEGSKSEPRYFEELTDYYQLNSANVEIVGESGSSPASVWKYAWDRYKVEKNLGDKFDKVYCVFDQDSHSSYRETCRKMKNATPGNVFYAITSVPCFEYWLLLHFQYTTKPYEPLPGNSPARQLQAELKNHLPNYKKGQSGLFEELINYLDFAKNNARRALQDARDRHTENPGTRVHELVEFLQNIKGGQ